MHPIWVCKRNIQHPRDVIDDCSYLFGCYFPFWRVKSQGTKTSKKIVTGFQASNHNNTFEPNIVAHGRTFPHITGAVQWCTCMCAENVLIFQILISEWQGREIGVGSFRGHEEFIPLCRASLIITYHDAQTMDLYLNIDLKFAEWFSIVNWFLTRKSVIYMHVAICPVK